MERLPRRRLVIGTQVASAVQSLALAELTLACVITLDEIIALAVLQGLIPAFDMPGRQSFLVGMVEERAELQNAIAINSSTANGAPLVGPAIEGVIVAAFREGWCFLIDGISYFAVIASLLRTRIRRPGTGQEGRRQGAGGLFEQMREGWDYVRGFQPIRTALLLFSLVSLIGYPYLLLMPVCAAQVLHGKAATLGWLSGATGVGALSSGISSTLRESVMGLTRMLQVVAAMQGGALVVFGLSESFWLSLGLMVVAGFGLMRSAAGANTAVQSLVTEDKRAGDELLHDGVFRRGAFGQFDSGVVAHDIGATDTVIISGVRCLAGALRFTTHLSGLNRMVRPIYRELRREPG